MSVTDDIGHPTVLDHERPNNDWHDLLVDCDNVSKLWSRVATEIFERRESSEETPLAAEENHEGKS